MVSAAQSAPDAGGHLDRLAFNFEGVAYEHQVPLQLTNGLVLTVQKSGSRGGVGLHPPPLKPTREELDPNPDCAGIHGFIWVGMIPSQERLDGFFGTSKSQAAADDEAGNAAGNEDSPDGADEPADPANQVQADSSPAKSGRKKSKTPAGSKVKRPRKWSFATLKRDEVRTIPHDPDALRVVLNSKTNKLQAYKLSSQDPATGLCKSSPVPKNQIFFFRRFRDDQATTDLVRKGFPIQEVLSVVRQELDEKLGKQAGKLPNPTPRSSSTTAQNPTPQNPTPSPTDSAPKDTTHSDGAKASSGKGSKRPLDATTPTAKRPHLQHSLSCMTLSSTDQTSVPIHDLTGPSPEHSPMPLSPASIKAYETYALNPPGPSGGSLFSEHGNHGSAGSLLPPLPAQFGEPSHFLSSNTSTMPFNASILDDIRRPNVSPLTERSPIAIFSNTSSVIEIGQSARQPAPTFATNSFGQLGQSNTQGQHGVQDRPSFQAQPAFQTQPVNQGYHRAPNHTEQLLSTEPRTPQHTSRLFSTETGKTVTWRDPISSGPPSVQASSHSPATSAPTGAPTAALSNPPYGGGRETDRNGNKAPTPFKPTHPVPHTPLHHSSSNINNGTSSNANGSTNGDYNGNSNSNGNAKSSSQRPVAPPRAALTCRVIKLATDLEKKGKWDVLMQMLQILEDVTLDDDDGIDDTNTTQQPKTKARQTLHVNKEGVLGACLKAPAGRRGGEVSAEEKDGMWEEFMRMFPDLRNELTSIQFAFMLYGLREVDIVVPYARIRSFVYAFVSELQSRCESEPGLQERMMRRREMPWQEIQSITIAARDSASSLVRLGGAAGQSSSSGLSGLSGSGVGPGGLGLGEADADAGAGAGAGAGRDRGRGGGDADVIVVGDDGHTVGGSGSGGGGDRAGVGSGSGWL